MALIARMGLVKVYDAKAGGYAIMCQEKEDGATVQVDWKLAIEDALGRMQELASPAARGAALQKEVDTTRPDWFGREPAP